MVIVTFCQRVLQKGGGSIGVHLPVDSVPSAWVGGMLWAQTGTQSQLPNTVRVPVSEAGSPFSEPLWFSPGQHTQDCGEKMGKQGSWQAGEEQGAEIW